jgi:hypothetical protein
MIVFKSRSYGVSQSYGFLGNSKAFMKSLKQGNHVSIDDLSKWSWHKSHVGMKQHFQKSYT